MHSGESLWYAVLRIEARARDWARRFVIARRNKAFFRLEMSLVHDLAARGRGCSDEWKRNHLHMAIREYGLTMENMGYTSPDGQKEELDEEQWVSRLVELAGYVRQ